VKECIHNLGSTNDQTRLNALKSILKITEDKVEWVYDVWDDLVDQLEDENSYQRSIAIMVLCNLVKSDAENRIEGLLPRLLAHTRDIKFIPSRQCIQNIWKVAATSSPRREIILAHLEERFTGCGEEKHSNLIRQDIIQSMRCLYDLEKDVKVLERAKELVNIEKDKKYRKKVEAILKTSST
jgi:hypothetical protein